MEAKASVCDQQVIPGLVFPKGTSIRELWTKAMTRTRGTLLPSRTYVGVFKECSAQNLDMMIDHLSNHNFVSASVVLKVKTKINP